MTTPDFSDPLFGKTAVILGFARQGQALARWLPSVGARVIVSDKRDLGEIIEAVMEFVDAPIEFALGEHALGLLDKADVLFLSGGVDPKLPICVEARRRGIPLSNDAQLFLERCPAPVIGITGSAGKTTTTTLIGEMCKAAQLPTMVGGNIGNVLLDKLSQVRPEHKIVMELSSFQLELMTRSPQIAVITNVTPNHLDRHGTMEKYLEAKAQIFLHQQPNDIAIFNLDDAGSFGLSERAHSRTAFFSTREMVSDGAFLAGSRLMVTGLSAPDGGAKIVCNRGDIKLRGEHNLQNVLAACAAAGAAGVPVEAMREVIKTFSGVPHRLEVVRVVGGVTYINDSIATAPERVIAALRSFTEPIILLAGGRDKKLPWDELLILVSQRVKHLITFGEFGEQIAAMAQRLRLPNSMLQSIEYRATLDVAVKLAAEIAQSGDIVLLSPGCTSYDAYQNFEERGEHFRMLVAALEERDSWR
ncbi:MAG: UDP-N-acetylmuramoyl-L-alanine--D-glutamate ligase [Candidatus Thermofonsia Clade 1 bacterium]|jgi:UDP-N-acetylmuramoylalanine--D-glutamate ligase|uniref:UDP-N-acetylmuramoylalanine--D-glutamate ligase n=1 Tax=Candidatus Thermofonsia Clade 1 bacterium TaxID=2364210 RepID=A0A2M8PAZ2_9CHLR|nr:MAG: UDP-N-acetylmuramoyl-L-alanine--D-glutamate ligase [Candidatus Thermofonsia Clade 1 bacterium]RMF51336.1 MAG: UDP-N-acetylmuramoyl-L-alanine--D-glutamate ligase [Chloroflexota bacterium]